MKGPCQIVPKGKRQLADKGEVTVTGWPRKVGSSDEKCKLKGKEGPCEAALARLKDGRLLCVYRMDSGAPYGHSFSDDDGKTWTEPAAMPDDVFSVQPSLAVLKDGTIVLSGGRPGLFLWVD